MLIGKCFFEFPYRFAERAPDLRQALRPEQDDREQQQEQELGRADVALHHASFGGVSLNNVTVRFR